MRKELELIKVKKSFIKKRIIKFYIGIYVMKKLRINDNDWVYIYKNNKMYGNNRLNLFNSCLYYKTGSLLPKEVPLISMDIYLNHVYKLFQLI